MKNSLTIAAALLSTATLAADVHQHQAGTTTETTANHQPTPSSETASSGMTKDAVSDGAIGRSEIGLKPIDVKTSFSVEQKGELISVVKQIIKENPEIVIDAIQGYSEKQQAAHQEKTEKLIADNKAGLLDKEASSIIGNPDGQRKLVVFVDPNCPHCREFEKILHSVTTKFPDLGIYFRHWAILGEDSTEVAKGLVAAQLQGKFAAISQKVASFDNRLNLETFYKLAQESGLNIDQLKKDMASEKVNKILEQTKDLAEKIGLQGTPTSVLSDQTGLHLISPTDEESLVNSLKGNSKNS